MKVIKSDVEILEQQSGIIGMFKHVERVARTSYHSENLITEDSWKKFCDMLLKRGHWACFEHGTVYLKIPKVIMQVEAVYFRNNHYTKFTEDSDYYYFTTNYRELLHFCQTYKKDPEYLLNNYWTEPDYNFPPRVTSKWVCSRGVSHELVRHRVMCYLQSSQRYIAYDIEKNGGEVTFIIPQWVYKLRDDENLDGEELWTKLKQTNRTVEARDKFWKACEQEYIWERQSAEDTKLKPEDARGVLCNDVMTEICVTSFLEDLDYTPGDDTTEKAGFFYLRTAPDAHPDFRVLAEKFKSLVDTKFKEYYENIK